MDKKLESDIFRYGENKNSYLNFRNILENTKLLIIE